MQSDWAVVSGSLEDQRVENPAASCRAGATRGLEPPAGAAGLFTYAVRQLTTTPGVRALRSSEAGFDPADTGAIVHGWMRRGALGAAPLLFAGLQSDDVGADAYVLGLTPTGQLSLRRGGLDLGVVDAAPSPTSGVLARSVEKVGTPWVHLKLEVACSPSPGGGAVGDVTLTCWIDVAGRTASPAWQRLLRVVDDGLGVRGGGLPLVGGFAGFGVALSGEADAWAALTDVAVSRQA